LQRSSTVHWIGEDHGDGDVDQVWDLAAIEFDTDVPARIGAFALTWDRLHPDWEPEPTSGVFVYGLTKTGRKDRVHTSGATQYFYNDNPVASEPFPIEQVRDVTPRPEYDLFFRYEAKVRGTSLPSRSTRGMSGGGVWLYEPGRSFMRLVGIVRDANPREGWIRATRIKWWMDQVEGRWPVIRGT
jgi:hypothetical protein